jgi:hypothetical protein
MIYVLSIIVVKYKELLEQLASFINDIKINKPSGHLHNAI